MLSQIIPASPLGSLHEESSSAGQKEKEKEEKNENLHPFSLLFYKPSWHDQTWAITQV